VCCKQLPTVRLMFGRVPGLLLLLLLCADMALRPMLLLLVAC
jgi:hypothetical protein